MRILLLVLLITLLGLQAMLWFGAGGYRDVQRLEARVQEQIELNEGLVERNRALQAEVEDLRDRLEAIEERARSELGLIGDDEIFYQVVPAPDDLPLPEEPPADGAEPQQ